MDNFKDYPLLAAHAHLQSRVSKRAIDKVIEIWKRAEINMPPFVAAYAIHYQTSPEICTRYNHPHGSGCSFGSRCHFLHRCLFCGCMSSSPHGMFFRDRNDAFICEEYRQFRHEMRDFQDRYNEAKDFNIIVEQMRFVYEKS